MRKPIFGEKKVAAPRRKGLKLVDELGVSIPVFIMVHVSLPFPRRRPPLPLPLDSPLWPLPLAFPLCPLDPPLDPLLFFALGQVAFTCPTSPQIQHDFLLDPAAAATNVTSLPLGLLGSFLCVLRSL